MRSECDIVPIRLGGPEEQRLMDRLFNDPKRKLINFNITPGERRVTREELCAVLNQMLDARGTDHAAEEA
jgi:hypothetical protein